MSTRFEGCYATETGVQVVKGGVLVGEDRLRHPAVVLNYDEVFYIEGTPAELRTLLTRALEKVDALDPAYLPPIVERRADELQAGDDLVLDDEDDVTVESVAFVDEEDEPCEREQAVQVLINDGDHSYDPDTLVQSRRES